MPWWQIIAILVVVALVVGVVVGVLSSVLGISSTWSAPAIGAAIGVFAAALISRRRSSQKRQPISTGTGGGAARAPVRAAPIPAATTRQMPMMPNTPGT